MRKPVAILAIAALVGVPIIAPPIFPAASGVATASKYCSSYAESRYGDRNVHTPAARNASGLASIAHMPQAMLGRIAVWDSDATEKGIWNGAS